MKIPEMEVAEAELVAAFINEACRVAREKVKDRVGMPLHDERIYLATCSAVRFMQDFKAAVGVTLVENLHRE